MLHNFNKQERDFSGPSTTLNSLKSEKTLSSSSSNRSAMAAKSMKASAASQDVPYGGMSSSWGLGLDEEDDEDGEEVGGSKGSGMGSGRRGREEEKVEVDDIEEMEWEPSPPQPSRRTTLPHPSPLSKPPGKENKSALSHPTTASPLPEYIPLPSTTESKPFTIPGLAPTPNPSSSTSTSNALGSYPSYSTGKFAPPFRKTSSFPPNEEGVRPLKAVKEEKVRGGGMDVGMGMVPKEIKPSISTSAKTEPTTEHKPLPHPNPITSIATHNSNFTTPGYAHPATGGMKRSNAVTSQTPEEKARAAEKRRVAMAEAFANMREGVKDGMGSANGGGGNAVASGSGLNRMGNGNGNGDGSGSGNKSNINGNGNGNGHTSSSTNNNKQLSDIPSVIIRMKRTFDEREHNTAVAGPSTFTSSNSTGGKNTVAGMSGHGARSFARTTSHPDIDMIAGKPAPWAAYANHDLKMASRSSSVMSFADKDTAKGTNRRSSLNIKQKVVLSAEQQKVLEMVTVDGKSLFFTGSAGTGKSVLLREIITALKIKYRASKRDDAVAITASTGIAACNIGGTTIHNFGGIGLGVGTVDQLCANIKKNKKALTRWTRTQVLIVDEISMVDGGLFDKLSQIGQKLRKKNTQPFGGIQLIVTGDFFQLPPVTKGNATPTFAFEAEAWNSAISVSVNLTKVFRQKDQTFVDMLNEMRFGKLSSTSAARFANLSREVVYTDGIEPTELYPRREDVEKANTLRLQNLRTESWTYKATDGPGGPSPSRDKILDNMMAPPVLILRKDAQVMLIKNVDETLVNGSMGKVLGFVERHLYREDTAGKWLGVPVDENSDTEGSVNADGEPKKKRKKVMYSEKLPVVSFRIPGGGTRDVLVEKDTFKTEAPNGEIQASRVQLPLILSWSISIHKSQGQTLDRVMVDCGRIFETGQCYVAISRATSLEGLQIKGFNPSKVRAHPKVKAWSEKLLTYS